MSDTDTPTVPASKHQVVANNLKLWFGVGTAGVGMLITFVTFTKQVKEEPPKAAASTPTQQAPAPQPNPLDALDKTPASNTTSLRDSTPQPQVTTAPKDELLVNNELVIPSFPSTENVDFLPSDGRGQGANREEALGKALAEAISKRVGAEISAKASLALTSSLREVNNRRLSRTDETIAQRFESATSGVLKWWDIRTERTEGGLYLVEVAAVVAKVHASLTHGTGRRTVVILPFRDSGTSASEFSKLGGELRDKLVSELTASRKFAVIDKSFVSEADSLKAAGQAPDPIQALIEQASRLEAEYLVTGSFDKLAVTQRDMGGLRVRQLSGLVHLRVIDLLTRQTLLARSYNLATETKLPTDPLILGGNLGDRMSTRILDTIYPMRVVSTATPGEITIDRGGEGLNPGDKLEVFNPGPELRDPATGESLGLSEQQAGLAEIIRVQPKVCVARLLNTSAFIQVGAVCRATQSLPNQVPTKAKDDIDNLFK